jgi:hypothetical protein
MRDLEGATADTVMPHLVQLMAGPMAEMEVNPDAVHQGGFDQDKDNALKLAVIATCTPAEGTNGTSEQVVYTPEEISRHGAEIDQLIHSAATEAGDFVCRYTKAIGQVADALLDRVYLTAKDVARIVAENTEADAS